MPGLHLTINPLND
jgi:hypothetical protein